MDIAGVNHHDSGEDESESQLFHLFPEIWEDIIVPKLPPTDFQSFINSCPKWRGMFKDIIAGRLLPLVLEILSKHWTVSKESLLAWRRVNRGGKSAIDKILEEFLAPKKYFNDLCTEHHEWWPNVVDENQPLRKAIERLKRCHAYKNPYEVQKFMHFAKTTGGGNLVLPKYAALSFLNFPWENGRNLNTIQFDFLAQFGGGLSSVSFRLDQATWSLLLTALFHLRNLKVLQLWGSMNLNPAQTPPKMVDAYQKFQLTSLELLDVEDLVEENIFRDDPERDGVFAVILRHCGPQLTRLICSDRLFENPKNAEALSTAGIRFVKLNGIDEKLLARLSSLEELHLENELLDRLDDFLPAINKFSSTLTHFQLSVPLGYHEYLWRSEAPDSWYPKMTHFSAYIYHSNLCWFWPFLQKKMINLTQLNLHESVFIGQRVNVEKLSKGFEMCPRLQKILVFWNVGNRENPMAGRMEMYRDGKIKRHTYKRLPLFSNN
ncbi:hypothetical protein Ocin01_13753 [Orchesella cincta]|uniref:Uncharacterized protein n=1 Tax=Orchesella cincta TaxID=48709 RepID=A0A1D2MIW3_ORCCI|nr:hypothetical protein Ocin01_13753 [Orchesella cincta]